MTTVAATNIVDIWHFCYMAFDGSYTFLAQLCQFIGCDFGVFPYLLFYPHIDSCILSAILSAKGFLFLRLFSIKPFVGFSEKKTYGGSVEILGSLLRHFHEKEKL